MFTLDYCLYIYLSPYTPEGGYVVSAKSAKIYTFYIDFFVRQD